MSFYIFSIAILTLFWATLRQRRDLTYLQEQLDRAQEMRGKIIDNVCESTRLHELHNKRLEMLEKADVRNADSISDLNYQLMRITPDAILSALRNKERFLDQANTRIDNALGNARELGRTAGEAAARDLVRECIERATQGKGPPLQILPAPVQERHVTDKIARTHLDKERS